jgi:serine/threonine protein kinase
LGWGQYGTVFKIRGNDENLYAYKKFITDPEQGVTHSLYRELSILSLLNHSNVIQVKAFNFNHIFLELAQYDLHALLHIHKVALSTGTLKSYVRQLCQGLHYLHELGIMHRDINPRNILIFDEGKTLKYADFGLSRGPGIALMKPYSSEVVTIYYRPPEVLLKFMMYDERIDVWSLGCVIYELVMGQILFPGTEFGQLELIFEKMGTPTLETWAEAVGRFDLPNYHYQDIFKNLNTDPQVLSVLKRCLVLKVSNYPTFEERMGQRAYMDEIMDLIQENPSEYLDECTTA